MEIEMNWERVDARGPCWEWQGARSNGYGSIGYRKEPGVWRSDFTHRVAWKELVGPIPDGMQLDHLCRNRICCNPDHLEPVTPRQNSLRGATGQWRRPNTCAKGHPHTGKRNNRGHRVCDICALEATRKYRRKKAANGTG